MLVGIAPNEVQVDVQRTSRLIPASELSSDPNVKPEDIVKIGDELDLLIMRTNDQEGTIMLSKKRLDAQKGWEVVAAAEEDGTILKGVVTEIIKGGLIRCYQRRGYSSLHPRQRHPVVNRWTICSSRKLGSVSSK